MSLFTASSTADATELQRIANESSRFNVGPVSRNFNVPTSAMFFFTPDNLARFAFTRKGTKKINGIETAMSTPPTTPLTWRGQRKTKKHPASCPRNAPGWMKLWQPVT
jgi:hypothetical protein